MMLLGAVAEGLGLLMERVPAFPDGLNHGAGDRGSFSGGESHRLVIARALLRRPSLLFLDEATEAMDAESEAKLIRADEGALAAPRRAGGRSSPVVAEPLRFHRLRPTWSA